MQGNIPDLLLYYDSTSSPDYMYMYLQTRFPPVYLSQNIRQLVIFHLGPNEHLYIRAFITCNIGTRSEDLQSSDNMNKIY